VRRRRRRKKRGFGEKLVVIEAVFSFQIEKNAR
jgi:hypothetical protein